MTTTPTTWTQINLTALSHNFNEIRRLAAKNKFILPTRKKRGAIDPIRVLAVLKADAYGHGMVEVAKRLDALGCGQFAVSDISEGIALRKVIKDKPILLLESTLPEQAKAIVDNNLVPTICTLELARALSAYGVKKRKPVDVQIEVDTGMGRLGIWHKEAFDFIKALYQLPNIVVQGIYTHFPVADIDRAFTEKQVKELYDMVVRLDRAGYIVPYIHAANSMGVVGYRTRVLNVVRPGLMLYGLHPNPKGKRKAGLKPLLSVHSRVIYIKEIEKGRSISYGRTFIAKRKMTVATVPIGYNDGYLRVFSNKTKVLVNGMACPVIGRVTMDQIIIDVSRVKKPKLGMSVTVLGTQKKKSITADDLAEFAGTINYEIVCNLGNRLPKVFGRT